MGHESQSKNPCPASVPDSGTLVAIMRILSLTREESGLASVEALPDHVGEDVRNVLPKMGAEEQV